MPDVEVMTSSKCKEMVENTVDLHAEELHQLSQFLWNNPEVAFQEVKAHNYITKFLESEGFRVTINYGLATAFRAEYKVGDGGPVIVLMCEYDALPKVGHACGHNLIAETAVGAGLAVKRVLQEDPALAGTIVVLGTPAEEGGRGKELLIRTGAFRDVDLALMAHPEDRSALRVKLSAASTVSVKFRGKPAHAAQSPWCGVNALDAAVSAYVNISLLRQQLKPTWRVHGVFIKAGSTVNVIPEESELTYSIRTQTSGELDVLRQKVEACFRSAAEATGCTVHLEGGIDSKHVVHNEVAILAFQKHAESYGFEFIDGKSPVEVTSGAATDAGNVSQIVPCIHPVYRIETLNKNHTEEFQRAAGTTHSHLVALRISKALALTALDFLRDPDLLVRAKQEFQNTFPKGSKDEAVANGISVGSLVES
ncbi:xaa-Arg dipeptidase-like [Ornithodoros turicata]|uniref:xaa-Arg dipeptidase-like n=1 Tax=Ornithodoros turicata TaxID=34597 RepID=UPI003139799E